MKVTVCCYLRSTFTGGQCYRFKPQNPTNKITLPQVLDLLWHEAEEQHSAAGHILLLERNPEVALHMQMTREATIHQQNSKTREHQLSEEGAKAESELLHPHGSANETRNS